MRLTKSSFLEYMSCDKSFWLSHHRPEVIERAAPSAFERMLARDGYAVEREVRRLIQGRADTARFRFQVEFSSDTAYARADVVRENEDGSIDLWEVKSSTTVKEGPGDHRIDAAYQMVVAERSGQRVSRVYLIHVNAEYVRSGSVDPAALFVLADVTTDVRAMESSVAEQADAAAALLASDEIDEVGCACRHLGSVSRRCPAFSHLNADLGSDTAHLLPRISPKRLRALDAEGRLDISAVREDDVTAAQLPVLRAFATGAPVIDRPSLAAFLAGLEGPVSFYDYESFAGAVPIGDGLSPHSQIPVQFSLHVLEGNGLRHSEFLAEAPSRHAELVSSLRAAMPSTGSVVVWNEAYEKGCNRRLARLLPEYAEFLEGVNARTVDLMAPFRASYVDARFRGSTSIKSVLPILAPWLVYDPAGVHDGAGAMQAWHEMVTTPSETRRRDLAGQLRAYCALDSVAMVEIVGFLRGLFLEDASVTLTCVPTYSDRPLR